MPCLLQTVQTSSGLRPFGSVMCIPEEKSLLEITSGSSSVQRKVSPAKVHWSQECCTKVEDVEDPGSHAEHSEGPCVLPFITKVGIHMPL